MTGFNPDAFSAAWNGHDLDAIMAMSSDDCVFLASAGSSPSGAVHKGQAAVRAAYQNIFNTFIDAHWSNSRSTWIAKDRVLTEWCFRATKADGTSLVVDGLDLLEISGDKVRVKNSYRKSV
jgi:ketosteroid isomerase-like protein